MSSNPSGGVECVGSLLVPPSDLQELSASSAGKSDECVGSLLVHSSDVQELSQASQPGLPAVNLTRRVTAVGTLIVGQDDLTTTPADANESDKDPEEGNNSPTIVRRMTEALQGPAPDDAEPDQWAD